MEVGDVVRLKSGGPPMTVEKVSTDSVTCRWFAPDAALGGDGLSRQAVFPLLCLSSATEHP